MSTGQMKFQDRVEALGFKTYEEYLQGEHWKEFRQLYRASGRAMTCRVCNTRLVVLHHVTYERLGREEFEDVLPLCKVHHTAVHDWLKCHSAPLGNTSKAIEEIRAGWVASAADPRLRLQKAKRASPTGTIGECARIRGRLASIQRRHNAYKDPLFSGLHDLFLDLNEEELRRRMDIAMKRYPKSKAKKKLKRTRVPTKKSKSTRKAK